MKRKKYKSMNTILLGLTFFFVIFISIGYSAINANLMISGDLDYVADNDNTLYGLVRRNVKEFDNSINFGATPTEATSGVYEVTSTKDDKYPVYYYRGVVSNNNVKFAGFCWKMVRTTSTGGVKLVYNGVPASNGSCNNTGASSLIGSGAFNSNYSSTGDVSYVYDNGNSSNAKNKVDDWYAKNIIDYTSMLEDTEWCNDRSVYTTSGNITYYGAYGRNLVTLKPSIECSDSNNKLTVGNGKLKYPVALLTADESMLAGHGWSGYNGYLNIGEYFWNLSPYDYGNSTAYTFVTDSNLYVSSVAYVKVGFRPSISLASGTIVNKGGDGSVTNPYTVVEKKDTLYSKISSGAKLDTDLDFSVAPTATTSGKYEIDSTKNDTFPVYYYRGIVDNNNVKFANFCWKMVRTTSTGGVKLIYNGVPAADGSCNNTGDASFVAKSSYNYSYTYSKYIGYTYDGTTNSTIKSNIDTWYKNNMTSFTKMLEDTVWCNDRTVSSKEGVTTHYAAYKRLNSSPYKGTIVCSNKADSFTVSTANGNGLLTYPVALLTADEVALAGGGLVGYSASNYLVANPWWTMTPSDNYYADAMVYYANAEGSLKSWWVSDFDNLTIGMRPAVSLVPGTIVSGGDGSVKTPYIIVS